MKQSSVIPWTPAALGAALVALYRADMGVTIVDVDKVSVWQDQSGNGKHLTQVAAVNRPAYSATGANGKPCVSFNGTAAVLKTAAFTLNQPEHVMVVCKHSQPEVTGYIVDGIAGNGMGVYITNAEPNNVRTYGGSFGPTASVVASDWKVIDAVFNGANSKLGVNGGNHATGNVGTNNAGGLTVGAYGGGSVGYLPEDVAGILITNRALTASERASAVQFFKTLAGIA